MADVKSSFPTMPKPTKDYDPKMIGDFVRSVEQLMVILRHPGEGRHSKMTFTHLPDSEAGLEAGALYNIGDGIVRQSMLNVGAPAGFTMSMSLGSVTVTIT